MRIYLAGMVQGGHLLRVNSGSENMQITESKTRTYPWDLESYHYLRKSNAPLDYMRKIKRSMFLDSGAFSMFTQGIKVDLSEYAAYIKKNKDIIHIASNLDIIGRDNEQGTYNNQKMLEKMGAVIQPVHHARDDDKWLLKYMAEGYDYIFLGGMVPETTNYIRGWLDHLWSRYLTTKSGRAKIKVHGFGMTTLELIARYPWASVDSISWVITGRFGSIYLDLPHKDTKITFSSDSPKRKTFDQHYETLDPVTQRAVRQRVEELGYDVKLLQTHYGWRDHFNIAFFDRIQQRPDPIFKLRETSLF